MDEILQHSVMLDRDKCRGCTTCIKHCPTQAIRVRRGKAIILKERCIDCGECIRVCPYRAKKAVCDPFERLREFKYTIALPAPSLYGQFRNLEDVNIILQGLLDIGFDNIYEVSRAAEMISDFSRKQNKENPQRLKPAISSACPAAVRLICMRFPSLAPNILPYTAPIDLAAIHAREEAVKETGLLPEQIGVFFITPCPAKVTAVRTPPGRSVPVLDGALSMSDIYVRLLGVMKHDGMPKTLAKSGIMGIGWATSGGESAALLGERYIAVDGIDNIIKVLSDVEDGNLSDLDFIEVNACTQGCVGGCLTVENPFVAKTRIKRLMKYLPVARNKVEQRDEVEARLLWDSPLKSTEIVRLDEDITTAMKKMARIEALVEALPGLDCGSCGAPSCRALAEDIVMGFASEEDCIFRMRERMQYMSGTGDADEYLPPPFRKSQEDE